MRVSDDSKSDMWALGCILYELCALKHAFAGESLSLLAMRILRAEYEPIPSHFTAVSTCYRKACVIGHRGSELCLRVC